MWRTRLNGPVFSKSLRLTASQTVLVCSTNGKLATIDVASGEIMRCIGVDGELFSSPVESLFEPGKIVIGCRNNVVYCLRL